METTRIVNNNTFIDYDATHRKTLGLLQPRTRFPSDSTHMLSEIIKVGQVKKLRAIKAESFLGVLVQVRQGVQTLFAGRLIFVLPHICDFVRRRFLRKYNIVLSTIGLPGRI